GARQLPWQIGIGIMARRRERLISFRPPTSQVQRTSCLTPYDSCITRDTAMSSDTTEHFDAIVLGTGQGGKPLALALAKAGWKTAGVERGPPRGARLH